MRPRLRRILNELGYLRGKGEPIAARVKYARGRCYIQRGGQWVEVEMPSPARETR